ncbi:MAG TPA: DUF3806 domain-containing protein [Cellvibrionaceae bacterium]
MQTLLRGLLLTLLCCSCTLANAQSNSASITNLGWTDESFLSAQRARVDELTRTRLGAPIRGDKSDLDTLQRIIDRDLIDRDDALMQQALGVILGDLLAQEESELKWKIYEDSKGRSRALCVDASRECLFPITMLSRRMAVGLKPNVKTIFLDALDMIEPQLSTLPYGGTRERSAD